METSDRLLMFSINHVRRYAASRAGQSPSPTCLSGQGGAAERRDVAERQTYGPVRNIDLLGVQPTGVFFMLQPSIASASQVQILTPDEDAIITRWLKPRSRTSVAHLSEAMARLGVNREPFDLYTSLDAAVASIILLPIGVAWSAARTNGVLIGRIHSPTAPCAGQPAPSSCFHQLGKQRSGLTARGYHLTWLPTRSCFIASADSDDCFGYCDFALGSVAAGGDVTASACAVISRNWRRKYRLCNQPPWAGVVDTGTVSTAVAEGMADKIWRNFVA